MNGLNYLLQSNLYLIIFFGFYWVLLRKETFNNYNRAYLVLSGLVSFAIPLWNLELVQSWFITQHATKAIVQLNIPNYVFSNIKTEKNFDITTYLSIFYGIGCFLLATKLILNIFNLYRFLYGIKPINKAFSFFNTIFITEGLDPDDVIYNHERVHASQYHSFDVLLFEIIGVVCWFNPVIYLYKIAIKNIHEFIADDIASSKLASKFDYAMLLFSEQFQTHPSVLVSNFFSKTSLKLRIEMLNKKRSNKVAVLKYGLIFPLFLGMMVFASVAIANGKKISELLSFNKTIEGTVLNYDFKPISAATIRIAGAFTETTTDKNGNFKLKTNSANTELIFSHVSYKTKQLSVINTEPIKVTMRRYSNELLGTFVLENQNEFLDITANQNTTVIPQITLEKDTEFSEVEKTAEYIGGSGELYGYLKSNLRYPKAARENKKQGIVYTQFMVNEKGEISDVRIANPLGYMSFLGHGLEAEAKRVVANMPNWLPARQNGEAVSSDFILPIQFILDEKEEKKNGGKTLIVDTKNKLSIDPSLYFIDGKLVTKKEYEAISPNSIESMKVLKGPEAIKKYGEKAKNGAIEIATIQAEIKNEDHLSKSLSDVYANPKTLIFLNGKEVPHKELTIILSKQYKYRGIGFKFFDAKDSFKKFGERGKYGALEITRGVEELNNIKKDFRQGYIEEVFTVVEKPAEFPGGKKALSKFLQLNLKYPQTAQKAIMQGTVFLSFIVSRSGAISEVEMKKGIGFGCDEEAIRVVHAMPKWKPAKQSGREVNSIINLPISFLLE